MFIIMIIMITIMIMMIMIMIMIMITTTYHQSICTHDIGYWFTGCHGLIQGISHLLMV
jgi:hypothetical protein